MSPSAICRRRRRRRPRAWVRRPRRRRRRRRPRRWQGRPRRKASTQSFSSRCSTAHGTNCPISTSRPCSLARWLKVSRISLQHTWRQSSRPWTSRRCGPRSRLGTTRASTTLAPTPSSLRTTACSSTRRIVAFAKQRTVSKVSGRGRCLGYESSLRRPRRRRRRRRSRKSRPQSGRCLWPRALVRPSRWPRATKRWHRFLPSTMFGRRRRPRRRPSPLRTRPRRYSS